MSHHRDDDDHHPRHAHPGAGFGAPLWTAVWFSAGLGAAYWWWSKLAGAAVRSDAISTLPAPQGFSPEAAPASWAGRSGEAPVEVAPPELVMAHSPPPSDAPDHPAHPTDNQIPEPPPEMLAHTPPESVGVSFKPRSGFDNPTHDPKSVFPPVKEGSSMLMASQSGEPVFDPEALATETSVAALTAGEALDETAAPLQAIGEVSPAPFPKPRSRRKPGTAPEA